METNTAHVLKQILSKEEYEKIPEDITKKLSTYFEQKFEELLTSKAVLESSANVSEETITCLKSELEVVKRAYENDKSNLAAATERVSNLQEQLDNARTELSKLNELVSKYEKESTDFRRQRDSAVDERNELLKNLERRNTELEICKSDMSTLTSQLQAAVNSKCEALAKAEEIESREINLKFKEKQVENVRPLLESQIKALTEDLQKSWTELSTIRRDNTSKRLVVDTKLSERTEELRIAQETIKNLTETNSALRERVDKMLEKQMKMTKQEAYIRESFQEELSANAKRADLYKSLADDKEANAKKLCDAVKDLQTLLQDTTEKYGELETAMKKMENEHEIVLKQKNDAIEGFKIELANANEYLETTRRESLEKAVESFAPNAAATSKLIKSGMTLTQIYSEYTKVSQQLLHEQREKDQLNLHLKTVLQEIEERAPVLQKQRLEYEVTLQDNASIREQLDNLLIEGEKIRSECSEATCKANYYTRENTKLKNQMSDLARQVCFLTKSVHELRGDVVSMSDMDSNVSSTMSVSAAELISKKLVTFSDIQELQSNNEKLLLLVREMSQKLEVAEENVGEADKVELQAKVDYLNKRIAELQESQEQQTNMITGIIRQRDTYQKLYRDNMRSNMTDEKPVSLDKPDVIGGGGEHVVSSPSCSNQKSDVTPKEKEIKDLTDKVAAAKKELNQLKEEYETYRKEKNINENMTRDQTETLRKELFESRSKLAGLVASSEYNDERVKVLKRNYDTLKKQISILEDKNKNYNETIIKHEQSIKRFRDEALSAQSKCSSAEVMLEQLRRENRMLKDSESRLQKQHEVMNREKSGQALLLNNLEMIKASIERSEAEGRIRLESRLSELSTECSALRRRLQEEQDRFRDLSSHLERQTEVAKQRSEEAIGQADQLRVELNTAREELVNKSNHIEELSKKLQSKILPNRLDDTNDSKRLRDYEHQLNQTKAEVVSLQSQLSMAKEHIKQYTDISECAEKEVRELQITYSQYKCATETALEEARVKENELTERVKELEAEITLQNSGQESNVSEIRMELNRTLNELNKLKAEFSDGAKNLAEAREQIASLRENVQAVEDKYAHEMLLHSNDIKQLSALKEKLSSVSQEVDELRSQRDQAIEALNIGKAGWEEQDHLIQAEKEDIEARIKDVNSQNALLHDQIQTLSTQLALVHATHHENLNTSGAPLDASLLNRSITEEDAAKSSEQLLDIIKYLRREKDIAFSKTDILLAENTRLKSEIETANKNVEEMKISLTAERGESEIAVVTTAKHAEVLRTVETLNAITDSNRVLREERDKLTNIVQDHLARIVKLEEELAPLQEENKQFKAKIDSLNDDIVASRAEAGRWRTRANVLVEKAQKTSPEDWKRLQNEREILAKMLTAEKEGQKKMVEELNNLKSEKARIDEQYQALAKTQAAQAAELRKVTEELSNVKQLFAKLTHEHTEVKSIISKRNAENTKLTEELASRDTALADAKNKETQIRKIAKKYKDQFTELSKTVEEEKKKAEETAVATANSGGITLTSEQQEEFKTEARKDLVEKIADLERLHNDKINEYTEQVSSTQTQIESLRKENDELKTACAEKDEKAKLVLKNAKGRIMLLTETKQAMSRELSTAKERLESFEQNKDENDVRLTVLKSQYEGRLARLEKEKNDGTNEISALSTQIETLKQKVNQLQRQLGQQGGKPSTSTSGDKPTTEPPTANIKPMAGHSTTQTLQHSQSATVQPWRGGETPFASIRPMSVPTRTVAVLPTSVTPANSSGATQSVLVPPQQQVHTTGNSSTGEAMSTSPTSSHMEYMPATSSAAPVRQAAVPPLSIQEAPTSAESTQDMESEQQAPQSVSGPSQQTVALVSPRVEPIPTQQIAHGVPQVSAAPSHSSDVTVHASTVMVSQQQASSSSSVTTSIAASAAGSSGGHKRPRDVSADASSDNSENQEQQRKRKRNAVQGDGCVSKSGFDAEIEYQVPTSSQRDQEDDIIVVDSEASEDEGLQEPDDGPFEDNSENYDNEIYEQEQELAYDDADEADEDNEHDDADNMADNNEVEVSDEGDDVPNQSEEPTDAGSVADSVIVPPTGQQIQAISSGTEPSVSQTSASLNRGRPVAPLSRQAQSLMLPQSYEEGGDDSIVPSTPTLYVPRRNDGFGEAVSSPHPHVPSARFTFSDSGPSRQGTALSHGAMEGVDDTRCDLSQFQEDRCTPGTPLQVCPQAQISGEQMEVPEDVEAGPSQPIEGSVPEIKIISVVGAEEEIVEPDEPEESTDNNKELEGDPVSSEGEQQPTEAIEVDAEEGREAEASQSPSSNTRSRGRATARRSVRTSPRGGGGRRPTPIIWGEQVQGGPHGSPRQMGMPISVRGNMQDQQGRQMYLRGNGRGRRMRRPGPNQYSNMRY